MAVTDALRASVFARDKGICAFSGLSLWILDYGTPVAHHDWVDHIRPASRGGKHTEENLVCASYFHNRKKSNNSSDTAYLFKNGSPTETYYWNYGELGAEQAEMLNRHSTLTSSDWYFNRALSNLLIALHQVWEGTDKDRVRKAWPDWIGAANKRLRAWRRFATNATPDSFIARNLVRFPDSEDVRLLLSVASAGDAGEVKNIFRRVWPHYKANADGMHEFSLATTVEQRRTALRKAERNQWTTGPLVSMLRRNVELLGDL